MPCHVPRHVLADEEDADSPTLDSAPLRLPPPRGLGSVVVDWWGLMNLDVSGSPLNDSGLRRILRSLPELESLRVSRCVLLTDEGFSPLCTPGCAGPRLRTLGIGAVKQLTDQVLHRRISNLPSLTSLSVSSCPQISSEGIRALCPGSGKLRTLYAYTNLLKRKSLLNDTVLRELLTCHPLLGVVEANLLRLTPAAFKGVNARAMRVLRVSHCGLGTGGIVAAVQACPNLTHFHCEGLGLDEEAVRAVGELQELEVLCLSCAPESLSILPDAVRQLRHLRALEISPTENVERPPDCILQKLMALRPRLRLSPAPGEPTERSLATYPGLHCGQMR